METSRLRRESAINNILSSEVILQKRISQGIALNRLNQLSCNSSGRVIYM